jgi:hypothetical protein
MEDWEAEGKVSIWLGNLSDKQELDEYMEEQYENDDAPISQFAGECGVGWYDHDFVESEIGAPRPVRELLQNFSYASSFAEAAAELAAKAGITTASCAVVLYNVAYDGSKTGPCRLTFLGCLEYEEEV